MQMYRLVAAALMLLTAASTGRAATNSTTTGLLTVDPPTLMALGLAWSIEGDDNRNAQVAVTLWPAAQVKVADVSEKKLERQR